MTLLATVDDMPGIDHCQRCLLEALLLDAPQCRASMMEWQEKVDFDALDYSSYRLIPALFSRFGDDPLCARHRARMKGIYRYFFYRNNMLAADGFDAICALMDAGIDPLVFKGMALALRYYDSRALRPMGDMDVLVSHADMPEAEVILEARGWRYRYESSRKSQDLHSHDYINGNKNGFDLHWHMLVESRNEDEDGAVKRRAEMLNWHGRNVRLICAEDLALVTIVNGIRDQNILWIYDIAMILKTKPNFDWHSLWIAAGRRRLRSTVLDALLLVRDFLPELINDRLLRQLADSDQALARYRLERLIKENRTATFENKHRREMLRALDVRPLRKRFRDKLMSRPSIYCEWSHDLRTPKHIHYRTSEDGQIDGLYLHWQHLSRLPELFSVEDGRAATIFNHTSRRSKEGWLPVTPGAIKLKAQPSPVCYRGSITIKSGARDIQLSSGQKLMLALQVENLSSYSWFVYEMSKLLYGVSYHLRDDSDRMIVWDHSRCYFLKPKHRHVAFIAPGQQIDCELIVNAPEQPGNYCIELDLVHEHVTWFSLQPQNRFPRIPLRVESS